MDQTEVEDLTLTDVVNGAGAELPVELFGTEAPQVMDGEGPQVEHIVPGERVPLLQQHHPSSHEAQLYCCPQTAGPSPDDHTLTNQRQRGQQLTNQRQRRQQLTNQRQYI